MRSEDYLKADLPEEKIFNPEFEPHNLNALKTLQLAKKRHPQSYVIYNIIPWQLQGNLLAAQSELVVRTPFMDNRLVKLMYQVQKDVRVGEELTFRLILSGNPELGKIRTDWGLKANGFYITHLLARIYYGFLFKAEYGFSQGMPHWLSYIENYLDLFKIEKYIIGRHKIENYRLWFKDNISDYIKNILLDDRSKRREYLKIGIIEELVKEHISGKKNHTNEINKLLTMELIQRIFIEKE
jgi:asparagine synthase (glutamine-hydrolysing)